MWKKKQTELTPEQLVIAKMQSLMASDWWAYLIDELKKDKEICIRSLVYDYRGIDVEKKFSDADILRNKIELIDDIVVMPTKIINEYEPTIKIDSPTI